MVTPKDDFIETYTKKEIEELKTAFDATGTYEEKVVFFERYFGIATAEFIEMVKHFEFPFPLEKRHEPYAVDALEKLLSTTKIERLLTKEYFGLPFSIFPSASPEWTHLTIYIIRQKFVSWETMEKKFWSTLAIVPEQGYFIRAQIAKFGLFDNTGRHMTIPFHVEHYGVFHKDPNYRQHLNRWFTLFEQGYSLARKEGSRTIPEHWAYLYELYFLNLGYVYAHYLGFLKRCAVEIEEKGRLPVPGTPEIIEADGESDTNAAEKGEFSHKSQLLLLYKLGILDLPIFENLTDIQRGKLFGRLLNRSVHNSENYIRYRHGKDADSRYALVNKRSAPPVDEILRECGLDKLL